MAEITPIDARIQPLLDPERELVDYCKLQLRRFKEGTDTPATRMAIVLMAHDADGKFHTLVNSWDVENKVTRFENCSLAAALLQGRALGAD